MAKAVIGTMVAASLVLLACLGWLGYGERWLETATPPDLPVEQVRVSHESTVPSFDHVFLLVMENKDYREVIGSSKAPFIGSLARSYGLATQYFAVGHPSLPNYLALACGSTLGMRRDCATCSFDAPNLVDQLEKKGKTWGVYAEDLPSPCYQGPTAGGLLALVNRAGYVRRHNPLMYFSDISGDGERCARVVPFDRLPAGLQQDHLPNLIWIVPNLQYDMHSGSVQQGDAWLSALVPRIVASPAWARNGVLFILWDEGQGRAGCCGDASGGHVPALVVASHGRAAYQSDTAFTHYSVLRTIEDAWQLDYLGHAADPGTVSLAEFFTTP